MRAIWAVPVIASILILGVIGLPQDVFSQIFIDSDIGDNVEVGPGESATITNGAIVSGNVIVDGGTVTINGGAVITGNIQVTNGGSLSMDDITVLGNVIVEDGIFAAITGSIIRGNVEITDSDDVIVSGNNVNGNIVSENTTPCSVFDNDVNGNLEIGECEGPPICAGPLDPLDGNLKIFVNGGGVGFCGIECEVFSGRNGCPFESFGSPGPFADGITDENGMLSFDITEAEFPFVTVVCDLSEVEDGRFGWWYWINVETYMSPFDFNTVDGTNMCCPT